MASRHYHRDHRHGRLHSQHERIPIHAASSCRCAQSEDIPPLPSLDHLLHLVTTYLEQQQLETQCCDKIRFVDGFTRHRVVHKDRNVPREYDSSVLSCLLRKIDDLDSSLSRFAAHSDHRLHNSYSPLRDSAARVIQTHFRSYLVRRSRTLRQLKELAAIKSKFMSLKSSVSGKIHFPFESVSRKAMDLLIQADSLQSKDDQMIRDGKKSLSRELVRFLQYVEGCAVKRHEIILKSEKGMSFIGSNNKSKGLGSKRRDFSSFENKTTEKSKKLVEKFEDNNVELEEFEFVTNGSKDIPIDNRKLGTSKSMKNGLNSRVTRTGNLYRGVYRKARELNSSGEDDSVDDDDDDEEDEETLLRPCDDGKSHSSKTRNGIKTTRFDENLNELNSSEDDEDSTNGSDDEVEEHKYMRKKGEGNEEKTYSEDEQSSSSSSHGNEGEVPIDDARKEVQLRKGGLMFSPPMPLKMES